MPIDLNVLLNQHGELLPDLNILPDQYGELLHDLNEAPDLNEEPAYEEEDEIAHV